MEGFAYKHSAAALRDRRMITISKKRGGWNAQITAAGEYYLQNGTHAPTGRDADVLPSHGRRDSRVGPTRDERSHDATVRAMRKTATKNEARPPKARRVEIQEVYMRYRVMVTRVQVAERYVRATDEEDAATKVQEEFDRPYGYFGTWKTTSSEVEVIEAEQTTVIKPQPLTAEGPLLLSLKDAGRALGLSYSTIYELVNRGELEHVTIGTRKYILRDKLLQFIEHNTHRGYHR
jgi:excisionase family DNA binding protein